MDDAKFAALISADPSEALRGFEALSSGADKDTWALVRHLWAQGRMETTSTDNPDTIPTRNSHENNQVSPGKGPLNHKVVSDQMKINTYLNSAPGKELRGCIATKTWLEESQSPAAETPDLTVDFKTILGLIRGGMLATAVDLCELGNEPWKSAMLRGGLLFKDTLFDRSELLDLDGENREQFTEGTICRFRFKDTCRKLANNHKLEINERACYAVLCGDTNNALRVYEKWNDTVWVYFNSIVEAMVDNVLNCKNGTTQTLTKEKAFQLIERSSNDILRYFMII